MGRHRTPTQLLQEALAKVSELRIKAAQHAVATDPRMVSLTSEETEKKRELAKAMRWLDPEKGLAVRISKLKAQIKEAESNLENAQQIQAELNTHLDIIQERKEELALQLSDGMELEAGE
jgi:predicted regulator of amino acid metabolism with ACT domain|tara:strand:- start:269 stop:628 length:360 start_codon:yes stop_codon:yes gene_type:complete